MVAGGGDAEGRPGSTETPPQVGVTGIYLDCVAGRGDEIDG